MSDDYLWDGSGEPDPEVERLERLLGRFKHDRPAPDLAASVAPRALHRRRYVWAAGIAAALAVAALGFLLLRRETGSWEVARLEGAPRVGSSAIATTGRLGVGQWLETDAVSRARINVGAIGEVQVEPNTQIRLVKARLNEHRLSLKRGGMSARIWAPPRLFFVDTPSAVAVDLGCAYTLDVDDTGTGRLKVTLGWVAFVNNGRESVVPSGAECITRPGVGPGTPYYSDASAAFRGALEKLDFERGGPPALAIVLSEARRKDGLTLWHLLPRTAEGERAAVYDKLASLVPPPPGVTRDGMLRLDQRMMDLYKDRIDVL